MAMTSTDYLNLLFQQKEDSDYFYLWQGRTKQSVWFNNIDKAVAFLESAKEDVYAGMAIAPDPRTLKRDKQKSIQYIRCANDEALGMSCLYMDIDIKHDVHQKDNLPRSLDEAIGLVTGHGYDPSVIIHSGYGIHCYWIFKEPWRFDTDKERKSAYMLNHRLCTTIRQRAHEFGWTVDSVFDLSRVLRVPGTLNCKNGEPRKVEFLKPTQPDESIPFYNPDDLDAFLLDTVDAPEPTANPIEKTVANHTEITDKINDLIFDSTAEAPLEKMMEITTIFDPSFKKTWERKRGKDLKDGSPSGYNFAIAIMCVEAGWTDQEVVDAMIHWRRKHGVPLKLENKQYYARTVMEARQRIREKKAEEGLTEMSVLAGTDYEPENMREKSLELLSQKFNLKLLQIIRYKGDDPSYLIRTEEFGDIFLPSVSYITSGTKFRDKFAAACGRFIKWKKGGWPFYAQLILNCCEDRFISADSENDTRMVEWVHEYLEANTIYEDRLQGLAGENPFLFDTGNVKNLCLFFNSFFKWAKIRKAYPGTVTQLQISVNRIGLYRKTVNFRQEDGTHTTKSVWLIPVENDTFNCFLKECHLD